MDGFKAGHIKRLKVKHFMTFDEVEIFPKSGLNLIFGLNGSGKSSIMCAICLVLGGKLEYTGRATELRDFIKHGHSEASIEVELVSGSISENSVLISRTIKNLSSYWYINTTPTTQREVLSVVERMNIDIGNLCQFLPQEKVVEFSKMNRRQRLENMLRSIGEPHLVELFEDLKRLRKIFCNTEDQIRKVKNEKEEHQQKNERLKPEVEKQNEREELKGQLRLLNDQKKVLEYEVYRIEEREKKADKIKCEKITQKHQEELDELHNNRDLLDNERKRKEKIVKSQEEEYSSLLKRLVVTIQDMSQMNAKMQNAIIEHRHRLAEKEKDMKRCEELQQEIAALRAMYPELEAKVAQNQEKMNTIAEQSTELELKSSELYQKAEESKEKISRLNYEASRFEKRREEMKNEEENLLQKLRSFSPATYEATCWLPENNHLLTSTVYTPILMQIKVGKEEDRKYVENHIPMRDLLAFVCEDRRDAELLTSALKIEKQLPINVVMAPDLPLSAFQSPAVTTEDKQLGFKTFLSDVFTCPALIMRYLCCCLKVHKIPICTSDGENNMEYFLKKFTRIYTPDHKIGGRQSKYGNKCWSFMKEKLKDEKLLAIDAAFSQEEEMLLAEIKRKIKDCENDYRLATSEIEDIEKCMAKNRQERTALREFQHGFQTTETQLKRKNRILKILAHNCNDEPSLKLELIRNIQAQRRKLLREQQSLLSDCIKIKKDQIRAIIALKCTEKGLKAVGKQVKSAERVFNAAKKNYDEARIEHLETRNKAKDLFAKITPTLKILAQHLPRSLDEVEQKIMHVTARLSMNSDVSNSVLMKYEKYRHEIEKAKEKIEKCEEQLRNLETEIEAKKNDWLQPMQSLVCNINTKFSRYYKFLNCAGEISLDTCKNSNDFTNYGLQIKLKYREDEPFMELSQTHHSGGECSVAAIIFILSLQELTRVPFRCIDEINQGMDSRNERKIYQLISDSTTDNENCSQYFLLTPKLLMDLEYPENVAVHIIYNSCGTNTKLNIKKNLREISQLA